MSDIYLLQRNTIYYFRIKIPHDIAPYFSRKEIWKSLKTKNYRSAKTSISKLLYTTERLFLHLRSGMYTEIQMKQLVKDYLQIYLNRCESLRSIALVKYDREGHADTDAQVIADKSIKAIDDLIESTKCKLLMNDFSSVSARVGWYIEEKGLTLEEGSVEYTTFCREILKAEIESLKIEKERMSGNYDNRYDKFLENTIATTLPIVEQPATVDTPSEPLATLSRVIEENIKEAELGDNWNEKTKAENVSIYKVITDVLGDVDINSITHLTMMQFRDKLSKLPANRDKKPEYKGKSIEQILSMKDVPAMNRTTLNKYLVRASSLFKWAAKHGYIQTNVAEGLTLPKVRRAEQEREAYSTEDIQKIIDHLELDKSNPHLFWVPMIGMYQGMRLDEICQLYVADIVVVDEVPCISVNSDGDKKLKNTSSERIIPIHPMLIKLEFMAYVDQLKQDNAPRLWGKLIKKRDGYSQDFGKWYQRFNRKYVTDNPKRVFHSFRHSLADRLKQAGVQDTLISEMLGHSIESVTMGRYGKRYQPKVLLEALKQLEYEIKFPV
jgi:integrase